jgi:hypothetical protein
MHVFEIADSHQCRPPLTPCALDDDQSRLYGGLLRPNLDVRCEWLFEVSGYRSHTPS